MSYIVNGRLDHVLERVPVRPDGSVQVVASRALPGKPLGPFFYCGTRSDDPNDIFPHQHRRELRGLRLFAAWLNHDDTRSINSLDTYFSQGDQGYVRHHLIDFGSCLGSGSVRIQSRRAGNEYIVEWKPMLKSALSLGLWDRPWRSVSYPDYPAVGRFESNFFNPIRWKPEYPNPAFDRMRPDDAFWATRIIMRFTDEMLQSIVRTGRILDPDAENYVVETLIRRKEKIVRNYLSRMNPLDRFQIIGDGSHLRFQNLGTEAGLANAESYQYQWYQFDNQELTIEPLGKVESTSLPSLPIPQSKGRYLMVRSARCARIEWSGRRKSTCSSETPIAE